jgi:hypothetical protein
VSAEPYALFDLVLWGSFEYADESVWRMCDRVYPIEKVWPLQTRGGYKELPLSYIVRHNDYSRRYKKVADLLSYNTRYVGQVYTDGLGLDFEVGRRKQDYVTLV